MKIKFLYLLPALLLSSVVQASSGDDPATTNVDWKFNGQVVPVCADSQKTPVADNMIGTYTGMINEHWYTGSDGFDFTKRMDLHFAIVLGADGIKRMWILPRDPDHPGQPQPMEFPDLNAIAKAGVCASSGYDQKHGLFIQLKDPKFGAQHAGTKMTYRIEVKENKTDKDSILFSMHKFLWSPAFFVVVVVPIFPTLPSGDYIFEDIILHRYIYPTKK